MDRKRLRHLRHISRHIDITNSRNYEIGSEAFCVSCKRILDHVGDFDYTIIRLKPMIF